MSAGFNSADTIAAIATAPGSAAIAIVRISGPAATAIGEAIAGGPIAPRTAALRTLRSAGGEIIDAGLVLSFPAPHSYTGENLVEFQIHGGAVVSDWLLQSVLEAGARPAAPGEFTLRAFLNDKLDLTQAEAVADLIGSQSRAGAAAARRSLEGRFSQRVASLQKQLTGLRVQLEAHLDFPDEDIEPTALAPLRRTAADALTEIDTLSAEARSGTVLLDGLSVVIAGPPNAGKSSLLNRLAGYDAAIVTEVPGTTRDPLREQIVLDGLPVRIVDTAGLRPTEDPIEREGTKRAHAEAGKADRVLWLHDIREGEATARAAAAEQFPNGAPVTIVLNKLDLIDCEAHGAIHDDEVADAPDACLRISALTGAGIESLVRHLRAAAGCRESSDGAFTARRRHLDTLRRARGHIEAAAAQLAEQPEIAADELRMAQAALGEITGDFTSDDLLGEIFSSFCIGK